MGGRIVPRCSQRTRENKQQFAFSFNNRDLPESKNLVIRQGLRSSEVASRSATPMLVGVGIFGFLIGQIVLEQST